MHLELGLKELQEAGPLGRRPHGHPQSQTPLSGEGEVPDWCGSHVRRHHPEQEGPQIETSVVGAPLLELVQKKM